MIITAKEIRENIESLLNAANYDECNNSFCNVIEKNIIDYAKQKCKEQREICSNLEFPNVNIMESDDHVYIRWDDIRDAPEPEFSEEDKPDKK